MADSPLSVAARIGRRLRRAPAADGQAGPSNDLVDAPTRKDLLGFDHLVQSVANQITRSVAEGVTPLTVGVYSDWGNGKTSFLMMIEDKLGQAGIHPVWFNAWRYNQEENLLSALLQVILDQAPVNYNWYQRPWIKLRLKLQTLNLPAGAGASVVWLAEVVVRVALLFVGAGLALGSYGVQITTVGGWLIGLGVLSSAAALSLLPVAVRAGALLVALVAAKPDFLIGLFEGKLGFDWSKFSRKKSYEEHVAFIRTFDAEFAEIVHAICGDKPLVIIIDDLDRCLPDKALQVLEGIKLLLDIKHCVFLLALDREIIEKAVLLRYKDILTIEKELGAATQLLGAHLGETYFDKIVQLAVPLPPLAQAQVETFVSRLYPDSQTNGCMRVFAAGLPRNPRKIKRVLQMFFLLSELSKERLLAGAVKPVLLAKIVIVQNQFRAVYRAILAEPLLLAALEMAYTPQRQGANSGAILPAVQQKASELVGQFPELRGCLELLPDEVDAFLDAVIGEYIFLLQTLAVPARRHVPLDLEDVLGSSPVDALSLIALHQLPAPPADFTGRAAELAELRQAAQEPSTTALGVRGLAGVGKTALALGLARELAASYPDAQFFVDLQGASSHPLAPADAMKLILRAYKPAEKLPDDPAQLAAAYRTVLTGQRALVLLDGAADRAQVEPLIPPAGCLLLLTSRVRFSLPGLRAVELDSLSPAEAEALLLQRAPRLGAAAAALAEACAYLPLALTLAGSALAEREDLEPDDYLRRLRQARLSVLDEVAASLTLSYDLLTPELQGLWRRLAVFPDSFDVPAAAAVWSLELDPASDRLGDLLRYSLLAFNKETRRYRLHDLARDFAGARLGAAERDEAQRRHAEHYKEVLTAAKELYLKGGADVARGLALFDQERVNVLAGQAWAAAHAEQDETAAGLANLYPDAGAYVLDLRQHPRERIAWLEAALAAARRLKHRQAEGAHLGNLGLAYADLGEPRRAIEYYEQQLTITREIGDRRGEGNALGSLGNAYFSLGEPRRAIEYYELQLTITREIGDRRGEGNALGSLGNAYFSLGEPRRAIEYYELQLTITREIGDRRGEGNALGNLGVAYRNLGEPRRAIEYCEQQLAIARELGDRQLEGNALGNLGLAYVDLGEPRRAIASYEQVLSLHREIGDRRSESLDLGNLGVAYAALGEPGRALEYYEQQLAIARDSGDRQGESIASWNLGLAYEKQGELEKAIALMQVRADYLRELSHPEAEKAAAAVDELRKRLAAPRQDAQVVDDHDQ